MIILPTEGIYTFCIPLYITLAVNISEMFYFASLTTPSTVLGTGAM